jgi:hypothetical protein
MPSVERWISEGMDPVHAAYAVVQHLSSSFAEGVSRLPEMKKYRAPAIFAKGLWRAFRAWVWGQGGRGREIMKQDRGCIAPSG